MTKIISASRIEKNTIFNKGLLSVSLLAAFCILLAAGCSTATRSQKGAVIGAAGGGAVGAVVGKMAGNTAMGAIIGAAAGGATGAVIGRKMDKQAEAIAKEMKDAEIIREGEGIIVRFSEKVLFAYDRSDLNTMAKTNLDKLNAILTQYPETNITVIGHTDSKGAKDYNQTLSVERAGSVTAYAGQNGINTTRLTALGKGETDPIATNETEEGRSQNRRVEFVITANEKMKEEAKKETGK
ncbi:MAG TPA: OmpA family protein [Flavisolibacter sp.]|nr:OmpA family protein [Flavisolibacter sp.]